VRWVAPLPQGHLGGVVQQVDPEVSRARVELDPNKQALVPLGRAADLAAALLQGAPEEKRRLTVCSGGGGGVPRFWREPDDQRRREKCQWDLHDA
jgi:hypothetical protein